MHLVRHLVAVHELASGGVPGNDNRLQIGKDVLLDQSAQDLVGEVERGERRVVAGHAARAPAVAAARPVDFVGRQLVAAAAGVVRGEPRRDDKRIVERAGEKGGGERGAEVMVGIAAGAVNHDQRARQPIVLHLEWIGAVDQRARLTGVGDPFGAGRRRRDARRGSGGSAAQQGCREQCRQEDARLHRA